MAKWLSIQIIADSTDNSELQKMVNPQDKVIVIAFDGYAHELSRNRSLEVTTKGALPVEMQNAVFHGADLYGNAVRQIIQIKLPKHRRRQVGRVLSLSHQAAS